MTIFEDLELDERGNAIFFFLCLGYLIQYIFFFWFYPFSWSLADFIILIFCAAYKHFVVYMYPIFISIHQLEDIKFFPIFSIMSRVVMIMIHQVSRT